MMNWSLFNFKKKKLTTCDVVIKMIDEKQKNMSDEEFDQMVKENPHVPVINPEPEPIKKFKTHITIILKDELPFALCRDTFRTEKIDRDWYHFCNWFYTKTTPCYVFKYSSLDGLPVNKMIRRDNIISYTIEIKEVKDEKDNCEKFKDKKKKGE